MKKGEEEREKKWNCILKAEGVLGWKIKIIKSGTGLCVHSRKEIWLGKRENAIPFLLHEIAHALLPKKQGHNAIWGDRFTLLVEKWWNYPKRKPNKKIMDKEIYERK